MTETHGTDTVNETISIKGLDFSSQLTIGAAKWLERKTGKPIMQAAKDLTPESEEDLDVTKVSALLTALYIAGHPGVDPAQAEAKVDNLTFSEMVDELGRVRPFDTEPKNSPPPQEAEKESPAESTGRPSSTT